MLERTHLFFRGSLGCAALVLGMGMLAGCGHGQGNMRSGGGGEGERSSGADSTPSARAPAPVEPASESVVYGPESLEVEAAEYAHYRAWIDGKGDPRLAEFDDATKKKKIAGQEKLKVSELDAVVSKVGKVAEVLAPANEKEIRKHLDQTVVKGRVREVEIDLSSSHPVAYVKWVCGDKRDVDKEASYVAWAVGQAGPLVKILGLWCVNEGDTKLFSAQIGRGGFTKIRKAKIERFAAKRYAIFFEKVKRGPHQ